MRIGIIGGGAMGQLFALALIKSGQDISCLHHQSASLNSLRDGIQAVYQGTQEHLKLMVSTNPTILLDRELVLICLKAYQAPVAAATIAPVITATRQNQILFLSLMNGLNAEAPFRTAFGKKQLVAGVSYAGARRLPDGGLQIAGYGPTLLPKLPGPAGQLLAEAAASLNTAGMPTSQPPKIKEAIWTKAIVNAVINPLAALAGIPNGLLPESDTFRRQAPQLIAEAVAVAGAENIELDPASLLNRTIQTCRATAGNLCSMLIDLQAGRRSEIDWLNGAITALASQHGLAAPLNQELTDLVHAREEQAALSASGQQPPP